MLLMWFAKPIYCLAAFLTTEVCAVVVLGLTFLAQTTPLTVATDRNLRATPEGYVVAPSEVHVGSEGGLSAHPKSMIIAAYTAMLGVIIGGIIQIAQLFMNSKNTALEAKLHEKEMIETEAKKAQQLKDEYQRKEVELLKAQTELLRQQAIWSQGWVTTILNKKPGEPLAMTPTFDPDPKTSTPQAIEQSSTLPLISTPLVTPQVPPLVPVPPEVLNRKSGLLPAIGTDDAPKEEPEVKPS